MLDLQRRATQHYKPVVDDILYSGCRDTKQIEHTLDGLLKQDDVDAIVNAVNCVGVTGKGIALQFKHRWPANFTEYSAACKAGKVRPAQDQLELDVATALGRARALVTA